MNPQFFPLGDAALEVHTPLARELSQLLAAQPGVLESVPALGVVTVMFDPLRLTTGELQQQLEAYLGQLSTQPASAPRQVSIPVVFDGPDLAWCAQQSHQSTEGLIEALCLAQLEVAFLGFTPGFAYLSGLPPELHMPRLDAPRPQVPAQSVALGGPWAGIYPKATPGGWRIVGHTPLRPFDLEREEITLLRPGDQVRFTRV